MVSKSNSKFSIFSWGLSRGRGSVSTVKSVTVVELASCLVQAGAPDVSHPFDDVVVRVVQLRLENLN